MSEKVAGLNITVTASRFSRIGIASGKHKYEESNDFLRPRNAAHLAAAKVLEALMVFKIHWFA